MKSKINTLTASERAKQRKNIKPSSMAQTTVTSQIAEAEAFCLNTVIQALSSAGLKPEHERYAQISRATAKLVIRNRSIIVAQYQRSKEGLKDWILWKVGLKSVPAYERIRTMGLTGDVMHDMEILGCRNVR